MWFISQYKMLTWGAKQPYIFYFYGPKISFLVEIKLQNHIKRFVMATLNTPGSLSQSLAISLSAKKEEKKKKPILQTTLRTVSFQFPEQKTTNILSMWMILNHFAQVKLPHTQALSILSPSACFSIFVLTISESSHHHC